MTDSDRDIDEQLRRWAEQQRSSAPRIEVPDLGVAGQRARRRWQVAGAAALVAAAAVAVAVVVAQVRTSQPPRPAAVSTDSKPPRPGQREWRFHGLAVNTPKGWPVNATECGSPQRDTVLIYQGPIPACAAAPNPDATWVQFDSLRQADAALALLPSAARQRITIDGVPAFRSAGLSRRSGSTRWHVVVVVIRQLNAVVTIASPHASETARLAATLRRVPPTPGGASGVVTGILQFVGGPAGVGPRPVPGSVAAYPNPADLGKRPVATARANGSGRFTMHLPPGSYLLFGASPRYLDGQANACQARNAVVVLDQGHAAAAVDCQVR